MISREAPLGVFDIVYVKYAAFVLFHQKVLIIYKNSDRIISTKHYERVNEMIIKASASLRNDYTSISSLAKKTNEPIFITKNGEGDGVFMSIDAFEKREQKLELRAKIMQAEEERLSGAKTKSISEARKELRERAGKI